MTDGSPAAAINNLAGSHIKKQPEFYENEFKVDAVNQNVEYNNLVMPQQCFTKAAKRITLT